ncbi:MAG TPA: outer membrane protein [Pseudolabrys sp.]|jgi:outer membrane immunogenic protein|nr:outer membrane protein [Pseudolabrys sp.]
MRKLLLAGVGIFALGITAASAADLGPVQQPPVKAPVYVPPVWSWAGPYIGINGGYGFGRSNFSSPFSSGDFDANGALVGGTLGYNWQFGQTVIGLEGDIDWSDMGGTSPCGGVTICDVRNDWLGTVRGRLGYSFDRFMPYITGGLAVGNIKTSIAGVGSADETKAGWTVGGGIEAHISGPWTAKLEYLHVDLGRGASVAGSDAKFQADIVRAGLNYKF